MMSAAAAADSHDHYSYYCNEEGTVLIAEGA